MPTSASRISRAASSSERRPSQTRFGARRQAWKSGSAPDSSSCQAPISSRISSGIRSETSRSSFQSVRWPRWPSDTATTASPGAGAGKESAASGTSSASPPSSRVSSPSASETTTVVAARSGRGQVQLLQPRALARRGVVGDLVAVPAPVPELGVRVLGDQPARERVLQRVEDHDRARDAGQPQPPRLGGGEAVGDRRRQPQVRAVGHARRLDGDDARGGQQILGLVAQDEGLELAREQQDADRRRLVAARRARRARRRRRANRACCPHAIRSRQPGRSCHGQTLASPLAMTSYLRRLLRTGAAYQLADAVSKVVALALLPVYTNHLTPADYGTAELLLTTIILVSIVLRLGLGEALVRFHFDDADPQRRRAIARTATGTLFIATTVAALAVAALGRPDQRRAARRPPAGRDPRRRARPVGVHEPRARLRAAAGRGARAGRSPPPR